MHTYFNVTVVINEQQGAIFIAAENEEQNFKEQDFGLAKICEENSVILAVNGGDGLRNGENAAPPRYLFIIFSSMYYVSLPCICSGLC